MLAIHGGPKAVTNKLAGWPQFSEGRFRRSKQVLRSGKVNYWTGTQGDGVREEVRGVAGQPDTPSARPPARRRSTWR